MTTTRADETHPPTSAEQTHPPRPVARTTALLLRRSAGRTAAPFFLLLVVLNTVLRSMAWKHEPMWAVYQYNFTVMLLGPLLAGVAGWEGYRLSRAETFLAAHHRPFTVLASAWAALFAWCAAAFLTGLAVVIGIVVWAGTPLTFGVPELLTPFPALALLGLACAAGLAAGWLGRGKLAAPMAAVSVFLAFLLLYAGDLSEFVMVGGATSSLVGLRPKADTQLAQLAFYLAATLLTLCATAWSAAWHYPRRLGTAVACALLSVTTALNLTSVDPLYLEARPGDVRCYGSRPEICLGHGYTQYEPRLRAALAPMVRAVSSLPLPTPKAFRQDALSTSTDLGQLSTDTVTGDPDLLLDMFLGTYYGSTCDIEPGSAMDRNFTNARFWLAGAAGATPFEDPALDPRLRTGTPSERAAIARTALQGLKACRAH
ncbi:hypothetical protein ACIQUQ_01065 [Streptomyces sp. NPDC101118]|uniref:hypothetical protein n=1 Tax=Streptomyces sp. NPDC101118 TaxID=3366109 RepID=UPI0037F8CAD9